MVATQHKGDHLWLQKALNAGAAYLGLVSSRHRAALVLQYMAADGARAGELDRVWAPAGLDLGAASPEEIALSGGSGAPAKFRKQASSKNGKVITTCELPGVVHQ